MDPREQPGYSAGFLHHLLRHWEDTDIEAVWHEWTVIRGTKVRCICLVQEAVKPGGIYADDLEAHGQSASYESQMPEADFRMDVERAYSALPLYWRGRTEVHLYMGGASEMQIRDMKCCQNCHRRFQAQECEHSVFNAVHRSRIERESRMPAYRSVRPQDSLKEMGDPYGAMARFLSGSPEALGLAA